jgi:NADPH:quinone reductase-like Zn-dependent oxidoreductase
MTAVRMYEHGGPEVLKVERHSIPTPDTNEVLIRVQVASVSWWDICTGLIKPVPGREKFPLLQQFGREAAGDVVVVGAAVRQFKVGDKVVCSSILLVVLAFSVFAAWITCVSERHFRRT